MLSQDRCLSHLTFACEFFHKDYIPAGMRPGTQGALRDAYRYSGLGCTFAAAVVAFAAAGWLLDRWLGVTPVFSVVGALIGAALGSVSIYRSLLARPEDRKRQPGDQ